MIKQVITQFLLTVLFDTQEVHRLTTDIKLYKHGSRESFVVWLARMLTAVSAVISVTLMVSGQAMQSLPTACCQAVVSLIFADATVGKQPTREHSAPSNVGWRVDS